MNDLKKYAGLLNDLAPKNHLLAYITPQERDMLVDAGGVKTPTPSGIFAYPPGEKYGGTNSSGGFNDPTPSSPGSSSNNNNNNNNSSGNGGSFTSQDNAREQYAAKQTSTGFVGGGGAVTYTGGDKDDPSSYAVSDAIVSPEVVQQEQAKYAEQFGGVAPLGSRPVGYNTKAEYDQMVYIADSKLDSIKGKLKQAGFTDFNKDATLSEMKDYVKTLNRTGKIGDSWKNAKDTKGNALYSPETIAEWESIGYIPQSVTGKSPGLFGKILEELSPSGSLGAPLTYDQLLADFDTITEVGQSQGMGFQERMKTYQPNRYASMTGMNYNPKTKTFTMKDGGGSEQDAYTRIAAPYELTDTTPQESMVNEYFSNMNQGSSLSYDLQTDYNNAKSKVNSILGIVSPDQQFGYSNDPYNGLLASNVSTNPFNIPYLKQRGLI
ncbi:hypothetical protein N9E34_04735 [Opitutales bacterium]|nr:hypothetical protein [Opitutales bacterium]